MPRTYDHFPQSWYTKQDVSDDELFYEFPRMVSHIDDTAVAFLREIYAANLPVGGTYLDLMSSRYSHIPESLNPAKVYGAGMNMDEMVANLQLDEYIVKNLNKDQTLPYADDMFDAVMCCVSIQYLEKPVEVFCEVSRVLKPGGVFIVSFSNRCFPTKVMRIWLESSADQRLQLVKKYMELAGFHGIETHIKPAGPMQAYGMGGDPLCVLVGC